MRGTFDSVGHGRTISLLPSPGLRCKLIKSMIKKYDFALDFTRRDPIQLLECLDNDYRSGHPFGRRCYAMPKCCRDDPLIGIDYLPRIAYQPSLFSSSHPVPDSDCLEPRLQSEIAHLLANVFHSSG